MQWTATPDQTLNLTTPPEDPAAVRARLEALRDADEATAASTGAHLLLGFDAGTIQAASLVSLGRLCHGDGAAREPARAASDALFGHVLPTPPDGREPEFFWRVAHTLDAVDTQAEPPRLVRYRTFPSHSAAAVFASEQADLISISEGPEGTTVWFREH